MNDDKLLKVIAAIPQQSQRQYGTDEQLRYLKMVANRLGLYDAADVLRNFEEATERARVRVEQAFKNDRNRAHLFDARGRRK